MVPHLIRSIRDFTLAGSPFAAVLVWMYMGLGTFGHAKVPGPNGRLVPIEYTARGMPLTLVTHVTSEETDSADASIVIPPGSLAGFRELGERDCSMGVHLHLANIAIVLGSALAVSAAGVWAWWRSTR